MRHQLELRLSTLMAARGETQARLAKRLMINPDHIARIAAGTWTDITRDQLQRLVNWAEPEKMIELVDHPIWLTFADSEAKVFLGSGARGDILQPDEDAFVELRKLFREDGCKVHRVVKSVPSREVDVQPLVEEVTGCMRSSNCVFIGGPRQNPATEIAIAHLWGEKPFRAVADHRTRKIPFDFVYPSWPQGTHESCFVRVDGFENRGLEVYRKRHPEPLRLRMPFVSDHEWRNRTGLGWDFGIGVLCRNPVPGSTTPVTTLVLAGVGGLGTHCAAREVARDSLHFDPHSVLDHHPQFRVLCGRYKKSQGAHNRTLQEGSRWVGPPWSGLPPGLNGNKTT
jgi:hypothetical protein